ncbi:hypothetical protein O3P69_020753 [Scylla paramamosain]|uniref:Uncharacterized protein n=1 Tax=Scylla paramamosain TaxID=85552 RepID=A0AAW0TNR5_SCYPA
MTTTDYSATQFFQSTSHHHTPPHQYTPQPPAQGKIQRSRESRQCCKVGVASGRVRGEAAPAPPAPPSEACGRRGRARGIAGASDRWSQDMGAARRHYGTINSRILTSSSVRIRGWRRGVRTWPLRGAVRRVTCSAVGLPCLSPELHRAEGSESAHCLSPSADGRSAVEQSPVSTCVYQWMLPVFSDPLRHSSIPALLTFT